MRFCEPLLGIFALKKRHKINSQRYFCEYIGCLRLINDERVVQLSLMGCCISYLYCKATCQKEFFPDCFDPVVSGLYEELSGINQTFVETETK